MITEALLRQLMPKANAALWAPALSGAMQEFGINSPLRAAAFLAQLAHESVELTRLEENLNYSAQRLVQVWPRRFTAAIAATYARQPERIANYVYGNRADLGNGDEASGDGWRFRGRGPIQLTGRANYRRAGTKLGLPLEQQPDLVAKDAAIGARVAGLFWRDKNLNVPADNGDLIKVTKIINGGTHGLQERLAYYERAKTVLVA